MASAIISCAECGSDFSAVDAEFAVETPEGFVHRGCFAETYVAAEPKMEKVPEDIAEFQLAMYRRLSGLQTEEDSDGRCPDCGWKLR